jgi:hypothetical protein
MRIQRIIPFVFGLCLLTLGNGCATKALWEGNGLEAWKQPDTDPHLRLFAAKQPGDILVVYNEYSERSDATHTRAYWLNQNQKLIEDRRSPHFVNSDTAVGNPTIPVFLASANEMNLPTPPYAVLATNCQSFTLYLSVDAIESHDLPFYNDQKGKVEKFALTPLATAADITIVGGILGYCWLQGAASSGASYSWKP